MSTAASPVEGRVIFLLATPESGAEQVLAALDCVSGVAAAPVPTHVFSQGVESVLDTWLSRTKEALGEKADDARFFAAVRALADAPLVARREATAADRIVEYSHQHIQLVGPMMVLYPDAQFVHVVRDGRQVAANLTSPLLAWAPFEAARRWCDDQRAVIELWDQPNLHAVRIEDLRADPTSAFADLAAAVGLDPSSDDIAAGAAVLGDGARPLPDDPADRPAVLVDVLGPDVLEACGYEPSRPTGVRRWVARAELGAPGEIGWALLGAARRFRSAQREDG
ncbi:MAG: sulfotransferase [Acidimicrobiia bacterium]|nr:sulfotransferase [Acidimicrobiia bacterium]